MAADEWKEREMSCGGERGRRERERGGGEEEWKGCGKRKAEKHGGVGAAPGVGMAPGSPPPGRPHLRGGGRPRALQAGHPGPEGTRTHSPMRRLGVSVCDGRLFVGQAALAGLGEVEAMEERSLTGTWDATRLRRWKWNTADNREEDLRRGDEGKEFTVTIWPKQIRTFFVHFASRNS
ncbi:unnamed protein product [Menidia menidia]|uniref:(Atlantic silverside) hypothetical protein n=1 Tax=Menidia menidia TaxID=238744 RepID=A0A8S4BBG0_9TELE|nr:unnamed protein product [Menidia menidia]